MTCTNDHTTAAHGRSVTASKPKKERLGVRRNTHNVGFDINFEKNPVRVLHENVSRAQTTLTRPISNEEYERAQKYPYELKRHWNNVTIGTTYLARRVRRNLPDRPLVAVLQGLGTVALGALFSVQAGLLAMAPTLIRSQATPGFRSQVATLEDRVLRDVTYLEWSLGLAYEHLRFDQLNGRELKDGSDLALTALNAIELGLRNQALDKRIREGRGIAKHLRAAKVWADKLASAVKNDIDNPGDRTKFREPFIGFARYI